MKALLANTLWFASCLPSAAAFRRATRNVARTQWRVLRSILQQKPEHRGIRSVREFQECVPLSDEPGEPGEPVLCRIPTSGTSGPTKLIPYTRGLVAEFQRGIAPWIADLFQNYPEMLAGKAYWAISPVGDQAEGFGDDTEYLGRCAWMARATLAVPSSVRHVRGIDAWRQETLRFLLACRDLTFISVWHPSFLTLLLEGIEAPAAHWPKLKVISCWADAAAAGPAAELAGIFPQASIQPKGLLATEGFVSLPLCGREGAALSVRSHFFEFLNAAGQLKLAHELRCGDEYSVLLTTSGGLYRYRLHDRVRVVGFEHECPLLRFLGKENHISDHFGEKVSEQQVSAALSNVRARFMLVACEGDAYTLFLESEELTDAKVLEAGRALEAGLRKNCHYRYCRELGQLQAVCVFRIPGPAAPKYLAEQQSRGQRLGDVKPIVLQRNGGWARVFGGAHVGTNELVGVRVQA